MITNKKAFTLIELMIVIAIIGILASVAVPSLQNARERSRQSKCNEFTSLLTRTSELFYIEKKEYPKSAEDLSPYLSGNKGAIKCPSGGVYQLVAGSGTGNDNEPVFRCSVHGCASSTWGTW